MQQSYTEELKKVMGLIVSNAPHEQLTLEINNLKTEITRSIRESQRILGLLDDIAEQFNIRPPVLPTEKKTALLGTFIVDNKMKAHIFEMATHSAKDGIIDTRVVLQELRRMGDTRSEVGILIGIGNILFQRGWTKIEKYKYTKAETPKLMEVK